MGDQDRDEAENVGPVLRGALATHGKTCTCAMHVRPTALPEPAGCPQFANTFRHMPSMTNEALTALGLVRWSGPATWEPGDVELFRTYSLWLLPAEWYDEIPVGERLVFITIFGKEELFIRGGEHPSSRDNRFGMLSYGIIKEGY